MRRALNLLLAFALLCGWQAALLHPLQHVGGDGELIHVEDGRHGAPAGKDDGAQHLGCDALGALASCVGGGTSMAPPGEPAFIAVDATAAPVAEPCAPVVYPSQAPPLA